MKFGQLRKISKLDKNFTRVYNQVIEDPRLSWKARGLFMYMWHLPNNWVFHESELQTHSYRDGISALQSAIKELRVYGYLKIFRARDRYGRMINTPDNPNIWQMNDHPLIKQKSAPDSGVNDRPRVPETHTRKTWVVDKSASYQQSSHNQKIGVVGKSPSYQRVHHNQKNHIVDNHDLLTTNSTNDLYKQTTKDKGARKVDTFHSRKKASENLSAIKPINDVCEDLWGFNLNLASQRRMERWLRTWSVKLIQKALYSTNDKIGYSLDSRSGVRREKSALDYAYALLENCRDQNIFTLEDLTKYKQSLQAKKKKKYRAKKKTARSSKNHVYHNLGYVKRTAQGVAMDLNDGVPTFREPTPEELQIAKYMLGHHMDTHSLTNIHNVQKLLQTEKE